MPEPFLPSVELATRLRIFQQVQVPARALAMIDDCQLLESKLSDELV